MYSCFSARAISMVYAFLLQLNVDCYFISQITESKSSQKSVKICLTGVLFDIEISYQTMYESEIRPENLVSCFCCFRPVRRSFSECNAFTKSCTMASLLISKHGCIKLEKIKYGDEINFVSGKNRLCLI